MNLRKYLKRGLQYVRYGIPEKPVYAQISTLAPNELLKERTALITGGTSGIGYDISKAFLLAGAKVIITGRNKEKVDKACNSLSQETGLNTISGIQMDITDVPSFQPKLESIIKLAGPIDILVNNAGILGGNINNSTEVEFDKVIQTNLKGVFFFLQLVGRYFKRNNIHGNILNVASSSSLRPATSAYTISKWGIRGLTLGLARILAPYDIVVNGIAPGPTATPMLMRNGVRDDIALRKSLAGRYATPEEIANMSVVLVSNMSRMVIGDIVYMTGGAGLLTNDDINYNFD